jgi:hypothetical protein
MKKLALALLVIVVVSSCDKTETFKAVSIADYFQLSVGKYVTYSLDSIVYYKNFGQTASTNSYQVRFVAENYLNDAQGRQSTRIVRYIRKNATDPWIPDNTFTATNLGNTIEFVENNMRFVKLASPIRQDYSWKGNRYIDVTSSALQYLDGWDYTYDSVNVPHKIGVLTLDSTIKVMQIDNRTAIDRTFSEEKYTKGIGLTYRNFLYWNNGTTAGNFTDNSYGIVMRMIDHN